MSSRIRVQRSDGRWLVIDDGIKDDCPILSDWDTQVEAVAEVNRILREELRQILHDKGMVSAEKVKRLLQGRVTTDPELPAPPLSERGFGV